MTGVLGGLIGAFPTPVTSSFESIATATGSGSSSVTFSSIPSTYTHLQLRVLLRSTAATLTRDWNLQFNGVTATSSYKSHYLFGNGTSAGSGADGGTGTNSIFLGNGPAASETANIFGGVIVDIHDYASSTKNKTVRAFGGADRNGTGVVWVTSGMNLSTSAITSLTLYFTTGNFETGSVVSLYGIKG